MLIRIRKSWEMRESEATPEHLFHDRRRLMKGIAATPILATAGAAVLAGCDSGEADATEIEKDPTADMYPVPRNEAFTLDRDITEEKLATTYNNFYEFGTSKNIWAKAQALPLRPWDVTIDGMVDNEMSLGFDDLLKKVQLEERLYRHRCVEAWSMAVPWSGFTMKQLVDLASPKAGAKYVRMTTFNDSSIAPGQAYSFQPWPYVEGLTIEEAMNDLAFIATGFYGKAIPKQNGAPLRLVTPWKYGFKSIKSIVRFTFTNERPVSFWEQLQASEYGFYANVNPDIPHPRWSQATEQPLGKDGRVPTLLFNGYADQVASLYPPTMKREYFY
jgi:sulfoxide reductase catalytic subunit YedY